MDGYNIRFILDDEAEATHSLNTAEPETDANGVPQTCRPCRGAGPRFQPFQPTPPEQAVSVLRQVYKRLACFDDMTLDELRGLIAFQRGGAMSDHDDRTCDGSREGRGGQGPPSAIVVEERELRQFAKLEKPLLRAAVKLAFKKDPRKIQLLVIRRLVFGSDDTILIAKTGFGKSLTFQAFTVLTGCWTIQLIPLNRLGEQHRDDAAQLPDISLVTAETKHLNRELFTEIRRQKLCPPWARTGGVRRVPCGPPGSQCPAVYGASRN
jgi:hypothetical protein